MIGKTVFTSLAFTKWAVMGLVLIVFLQISACTSTKTASGDIAKESRKLELKAGDEIRVISSHRERFKMRITEIKTGSLTGETVEWKASKTPPGHQIQISYSELAFVQIDKPSPAKTAGLVASVALIGGMVAAISAVPLVVLP